MILLRARVNAPWEDTLRCQQHTFLINPKGPYAHPMLSCLGNVVMGCNHALVTFDALSFDHVSAGVFLIIGQWFRLYLALRSSQLSVLCSADEYQHQIARIVHHYFPLFLTLKSNTQAFPIAESLVLLLLYIQSILCTALSGPSNDLPVFYSLSRKRLPVAAYLVLDAVECLCNVYITYAS